MHPDQEVERDINTAINFMRNGDPVPVDLTSRIVAAGVDYSALEEKYST